MSEGGAEPRGPLYREEALRHHRAGQGRREPLRDVSRLFLTVLWIATGVIGAALVAVALSVLARL